MKCLKTGLHLYHNGNSMYCDMYGDLDKNVILIKGFAPKSSFETEPHACDIIVEDERLVPSEKFEEFMNRVNREFVIYLWTEWMWVVFDQYNRFDTEVNVPDV